MEKKKDKLSEKKKLNREKLENYFSFFLSFLFSYFLLKHAAILIDR